MTDDNIQTAPHFDYDGVDFTDKKVLVIGSGSDLNGRKMATAIDTLPEDGGEYDYVIRCNKMFGSTEDVGTRCDLAAVRYPEWTNQYGLTHAKDYISFNGHLLGGMPPRRPGNWTERERNELAKEIGVPWPSCGALAVNWASKRGCSKENLTVIGFGYNPETQTFSDKKCYPNGRVDKNKNYNWEAENAWIREHATLI